MLDLRVASLPKCGQQRTGRVFPMDIKDLTLVAFTICNSLRLLAYTPQILSAARDRGNCAGVSCATWAMFLLANSSASAYALINLTDLRMAVVFAVNAACCAVILAIVGYKRRRFAQRREPFGLARTAHAFDKHARHVAA